MWHVKATGKSGAWGFDAARKSFGEKRRVRTSGRSGAGTGCAAREILMRRVMFWKEAVL